MEARKFVVWDYAVFVAVLVISASVGVYFAFTGGRQKTNSEFLMANRQMSVVPVAISMVVTIISAITLVGTPGEMYTYGNELWLYSLAASLGYFLTAVLFVPLLFPLKLTSAYEYLQLRFKSKSAKLVGSFITLVNAILYMGVAMYAPATAMEIVTGSPYWVTLILTFVVSSFYSALGGIKAVIWVDALQSFIMLAGVIAILIKGSIEVGGFDKVWEINDMHNRVEPLHLDPNPLIRHTFWTIVVGGMVDILARTGVYQAAVQRYCSVPTLTKAKVTTLMNAPIITIIWSLTCMVGMTMFAYYSQKGCDPLAAGYVSNPNQLIMYFLMDILYYPGVPGLFVGSVMSAVLSTISSIQSAAAAIFWEDWLKGFFKKMPAEKQTMITKGLVVLFGAAGTGLAFFMATVGGTVIQVGLAFIGASVGPLLGLFLLGSVFPWSNWIGAIVGGLTGLAFPLWISFGSLINKPPVNYLPTDITNCTNYLNITAKWASTTPVPTIASEGLNGLYSISYQYNGCIGMATVVVVGLIVSFITGAEKIEDADPKLMMPIFDWLFCCLPRKCSRALSCGIDYDKTKEMRKKGEDFFPPESDEFVEKENGIVNESATIESSRL
ncbi:sodium-coupled monocarboxylate transporter 2-like isoform X1 [Lingula anatina]|uniref:Sodium-coupled monocarboxylate transporter 2-like isoform X1 n=2 Tax=Lingula anatina TaxID=7574 RepID=A0A1S3JT13_LINAN|nr:sodium-coupled monocarboxylate transporter 2-like isoform X1 [Lingula anatina]|eukprot:XP_013413179.1 sodium-coupled monocarboxylate transporter 2-like isoform X1 [Lingula anatina]